ncbi:MAG: CDGSH iron-sulfur domain-containing protein [Anaerolineales bacterium]|jgi:CDGSH-type Zn-finger protein
MLDVYKIPSSGKKRITIIKNGPYGVCGGVPLVSKTQIVSEFGEPLTWKKDGELETLAEEYHLCRCGQSGHKPFCDGTHRKIGFDGTEHAKTHGPTDFQFDFRGGIRLIVKKDPSICMNSGYCGMRDASISQFIAASSDTKMRSLAIAMVERCPSGALTYKIEKGEDDIEPDFPQQIAATTEITSDGPIAGPLWVTGCIPIERSDGQPFNARNRVTLCNCGLSRNKPLCDGTHRDVAQRLARAIKNK